MSLKAGKMQEKPSRKDTPIEVRISEDDVKALKERPKVRLLAYIGFGVQVYLKWITDEEMLEEESG